MTRDKLLLATGCAALLAAVASAQAPQQASPGNLAPPYKNLKVLSAGMTQPQLMQTMKFFSQSLGVRCTHCHVGAEGQPLSSFDFASDAKREKLVARSMLTMVHKINSEEFGVTDFSNAKVTCYTCHRGALKPATTLPEPPAESRPETTERGGA